MARYGEAVCMLGRMPEVLSDDLGNTFNMVRLKSAEEGARLAEYVHERA